MSENVVDQYAAIDQVDAPAARHELGAVKLEFRWSAHKGWHTGFFKARLQNFKLTPGGDFAPVHNGNQGRRGCSAPIAITLEQSREQALHQRKLTYVVVLGEPLHHRQRAKHAG